mmetsp:Transcript_11498/g.33882  ORF Transcript_11498/g.33882 Transcript_11498/m.33882 type:complete len:533 (-) Transcript_11498:189-1787(-)
MSHPYYSADGVLPVVQSTVVQGGTPSSNNVNIQSIQGEGAEWTKGEVQQKKCNDPFFAILFYAHLGVMAWCAATYVPLMTSTMVQGYNGYGGERLLYSQGTDEALGGKSTFWHIPRYLLGHATTSRGRTLEDDEENVTINDAMCIIGITGVVGFIVSALALSLMTHFASVLIKFALWFNIIVSLLIGIMGIISGVVVMALVGFLSCAFTSYYAYLVWGRIPFAASNLITGITAVRANFGLSFLAYSSLLFLVGWWLWWSAAYVASMFVYCGCDAAGQCEREMNGILVFLFLISLFWTLQVIKNTVHTTVAGTVGTWWFVPTEASSCCSPGVRDSFVRSITFSFGSICLGSLIVAIIQAMKQFLHKVRENDDGIFLCCAECLLGCLESLAEYFNQWAFCYVGLYGYTFIEAGRNVMALFKSRGWTTIITDDLIHKVLLMVSVGIGLITGLISVMISNARGLVFDATSAGVPFFFGLLIGYYISSVLMGLIGSAVNTVIVLYAEAPNEFQQNHPKLSTEMRSAWRQAWPVDFRY